MAFHKLIPSSVREYSTRGGISAYDSRFIKPSLWSFLSVCERVFGLTFGKWLSISLNLAFSQFPIVLMASRLHFLLIMSMTPSSGHFWGDSIFLVNLVTVFGVTRLLAIHLLL